MAPSRVASVVAAFTRDHKVAFFSKSKCPFCIRIKDFFKANNVDFSSMELDLLPGGDAEMNLIQDHLKLETGIRSVPNVWINNTFAGDSSQIYKMHEERKLFTKMHGYDYDLVVLGGGSGGLAASKKAASFGRKVACLDFVKPTPSGTKWGLGGTCVNVGCIPKKLMHTAALHADHSRDFSSYGWDVPKEETDLKLTGVKNHDWKTLRDNISDYICGLNFGYRNDLRSNNVEYINAYGSLVDKNTIAYTTKKGKGEQKMITSERILIAVGERPRYPDNVENVQEYTITSDDLFSSKEDPGKTLVIGASYVALECAGFLNGIGKDVTVMVRSIFLRGFDQDMAERLGEHMKEEGVKFLRPCTLESIEKVNPGEAKSQYRVKGSDKFEDTFDTVVYAIGREADLESINVAGVGVDTSKNGKKVWVDDWEQTSVNGIYAIGDAALNRPELTPAAIQGGEQLATRLFSNLRKSVTDYVNIPTTVFTPLEYSCCGYSEEAAEKKFGKDNILTYHRNVMPLEWNLAHRDTKTCYMKMIVTTADNVVVGLHYAGPNAGELMQGFAVAMKMRATKDVFDETVGIHPTNAEWFTTLQTTKQSGEELTDKGC